MPYGNAQSLSADDYYALTAYLLYLSDIVAEQNFELSRHNLAGIRMPNEAGFYLDDRPAAEKSFWREQPCMTDCSAPVAITGRAGAIDVTPEDGRQAKAPGME